MVTLFWQKVSKPGCESYESLWESSGFLPFPSHAVITLHRRGNMTQYEACLEYEGGDIIAAPDFFLTMEAARAWCDHRFLKLTFDLFYSCSRQICY